VGAIEIKASWRILDTTKGDELSRYYHQQAQVTIGSQYTWSGNQLQFTATVGLVGFHIIHKTRAFSREIWSTFEHIDNVPDDLLEAHDPQHGYSFYQPVCYSCPVNAKPGEVKGKMAMWNDTPPYAAAYGIVGQNNEFRDTGVFGSQIVRVFPIFVTTDSLNKIFQAKLAGTVWANYKLVGTQWFKGSTDSPGGPQPPNAPARLANTTLETYDQNTASCTTCHGFAYIAGGGTDSTSGPMYKSDFSFLFRKAAHPSSSFSSANPLGQKAQVPAPPKKK
jgi:mono/diheme cytochrome c family protein